MPRTIRFVLSLVLLALYVMPFWGNFGGSFWPAGVRAYSGCLMRWLWRWYREHAPPGGDAVLEYRLLWLGVSVALGLLFPLAVTFFVSRRPADVGLGRPNRWGWRMVLVGLAIVVPMAAVFAVDRRAGLAPGAAAIGWAEAMILLGVSVPEHFLLTGAAIALLLPGMRLPEDRMGAKVCNAEHPSGRYAGGTASPLVDVARRLAYWLGLAQPTGQAQGRFRRGLAWWGLDPEAFLAIVGGGLLFGFVHVGARPIEFVTSFPGGLLLCYVTVRSRSIWPGWCVHVVQMALVILILS